MKRREFLHVVLGSCGGVLASSLATRDTMGATVPPSATCRLSYLQPVTSPDPHGSASADRITWIVGQHLFNRLLSWDYGAKKFQPELALNWRNPDPTIWEFELRRGVKFHDGTEFTSAAVKTSLERVQAMRGPLAPLFAPVDSVTAPDPYRVIVKTHDPMGTLLSSLTVLYIVPAGTPATPAFGDNPVGTGPFKFASFSRGAQLVLDANTAYWVPGIPKMQRLIFVEIPEVSARVAALSTGEIDMVVGLPPQELPGLRANSAIHLAIGPTSLIRTLWMGSGPLSNVNVRRAIRYAINVKAITSSLMANIAEPATSFISTNTLLYAKMEPQYDYNPAMAMKLLSNAGYPRGFQATLKWTIGNPAEAELADAIIGELALVGITVRNVQQTHAIWLNDLLKLDFDFLLVDTGGGPIDPDFTLRRLYDSKSKRVPWSSPQFDQQVEGGVTTLDLEKRRALYLQAQQILWNESPISPLFEEKMVYALRTRVQGFKTPLSEVFNLNDVSVT
jgi:peptide/nickel transport system substrate-binding protein